jgi:ABC-type branched-subunit amino acid transport system substrate-binding protein
MESIKKKLEAIIKKAQENMKDVWSEDLETVSTAAITSDLDDIEYNGWFDDLVALVEELKELEGLVVLVKELKNK